jgi:protease-4
MPCSWIKCGGLLFLSIIAVLIFQLSFKGDVCARINDPFQLPVPPTSVSHSTGEFSPLINPVFSDVLSSSLTYRHLRYEGMHNGNHLFLVNLAGFTLSYLWLNNIYGDNDELTESARTKLFGIGKGFWLSNVFGFGVSYSLSKSSRDEYDDYKTWTAGLLLRPARFISLGFTSRNINSPEIYGRDVKREDIYSISVRPLGEGLTLSFDMKKIDGEGIGDSNYLFSADINLFKEISLFASADRDKNFSIGMSIPVGMSGTRGSAMILDYYGVNNRDVADSSQFGFALSDERRLSSIVTIKRILLIRMSGPVEEIGYEGLFTERGIKFFDILEAVRSAARDDSIEGIIIAIDGTGIGFAQVQELRERLRDFKSSRKKIYAVLISSGNKDYYLASVADKIYFIPSSTFSLSGLRAEVYFFRGALEKVGVRFESVKRGKYKSFNEQFTREHMSEEYRENLTSILEDLNNQFLDDIVKDRKISRDEIEKMMSTGLLTPKMALDAGFIDSIEYQDDAVREIVRCHGFNCTAVDLEDYVREKKKLYRWGPIPHVAVVYVVGNIIRGKSQFGRFYLPESTGDENYREILDEVFRDRRIRAVVIRIDSGGGSAVASDLMWHYLYRLKKRYNKPVVISFGNTAASGGYYIACTGDKIFASRGTITGSIGVVSGKLSLKRLYEKLGINKDVIKMSEFADILSESKDLNSREREILMNSVGFIYRRFTDRVSEARGIAEGRIPDVAEGRVFTGNQAQGNRLVDNIGGLIASIEFAKKISGIRGICRIEHLPRREGSLMDLIGFSPSDAALGRLVRPLLENFKWVGLGDEAFLYLYPYGLEIE